jgi:hypothetical protein
MPNPLSTLIPATIPIELTYLTKLIPSLLLCLAVSYWKMTPEMYSLIDGAVRSMFLYLLLFSALFSSPIGLNFLSTDPGD